jgi:hypothetical protein
MSDASLVPLSRGSGVGAGVADCVGVAAAVGVSGGVGLGVGEATD